MSHTYRGCKGQGWIVPPLPSLGNHKEFTLARHRLRYKKLHYLPVEPLPCQCVLLEKRIALSKKFAAAVDFKVLVSLETHQEKTAPEIEPVCSRLALIAPQPES